jgi:hypothetical protein
VCVCARAIARVLVLENERCPRQIPSARPPPLIALLEKNVAAIERAPPAKVLDFLGLERAPARSDSFFFFPPPPTEPFNEKEKKN